MNLSLSQISTRNAIMRKMNDRHVRTLRVHLKFPPDSSVPELVSHDSFYKAHIRTEQDCVSGEFRLMFGLFVKIKQKPKIQFK